MQKYDRIHRICTLLERAWLYEPDQRLFQFAVNYLGKRQGDLWFQEDDETEEMLDKFLDDRLHEGMYD